MQPLLCLVISVHFVYGTPAWYGAIVLLIENASGDDDNEG